MSPTRPAMQGLKRTVTQSDTPRKKKTRATPAFKVRFGLVSASEAAEGRDIASKRDKSQLVARRTASEIPTSKLTLTPGQRESLDALYKSQQIEEYKFVARGASGGEASQVSAAAIMASRELDLDSRESASSRWSVKWCTIRGRGTDNEVQCVLYQW
jgi:hypothetical protein